MEKTFTITLDSSLELVARFFGEDKQKETIYTSVVFGKRIDISGEDNFRRNEIWDFLIASFSQEFIKDGITEEDICRIKGKMKEWMISLLK
jgi:hypothetical protein